MMDLEIEPVKDPLYRLKNPIDLRLLRLQAGYKSIRQFADACDLSFYMIQGLETGTVIEARLSELQRIKQVLKYGVVHSTIK